MRPTVYIETTIISYLTGRKSRHPIVAGRQALTREWWDNCRERFEAFVSPFVVTEAQDGDPHAAKRRIEAIEGIPALAVTEEVRRLAESLIGPGPMPEQYPDDALHVAICAVNGLDYLVTWNCTHLANATLRRQVERFLAQAGYECPVICTPEELMEV